MSPAVLAACGDDSGSSAATTAGGGGAATTAAGGAATTGGAASGDVGATLAKLLEIDAATSGAGMEFKMGNVLALTGTGSFYGKTMSRGTRPRRQAHRGGRRPEDQRHLPRPQVGRRRRRQGGHHRARRPKNVPAKFASYVDDLGAMLDGTAQYKIFTLDGGGGTSIFGQGKPYFWGTRAITPNDPLPGLFKYTKETCPTPRPSGLIGWDIGEPNNSNIKADVLKKIAAGGYTHNGLYELRARRHPGLLARCFPKIKANEPDILLCRRLRPGPRLVRQPGGHRRPEGDQVIGFEFTPDGVNASKGTYDKDGYDVRLRLLRRQQPEEPVREALRATSSRRSTAGDLPDFYAANFYENTFVLWEVIRRVLQGGGDINERRRPRQGAAGRTSRW